MNAAERFIAEVTALAANDSPAFAAELAAVPDCREVLALLTAWGAAGQVFDDPVVWRQEAARRDAPAIPWPQQAGREGFAAQRLVVMRHLVGKSLLLIRAKTGSDPTPEKLELLLRVASRAADFGAKVAQHCFGGRGRGPLRGRNLWKQWHDRRLIAIVEASGLPRLQQMELLRRYGVGSQATVYRKRPARR